MPETRLGWSREFVSWLQTCFQDTLIRIASQTTSAAKMHTHRPWKMMHLRDDACVYLELEKPGTYYFVPVSPYGDQAFRLDVETFWGSLFRWQYFSSATSESNGLYQFRSTIDRCIRREFADFPGIPGPWLSKTFDVR